MGIKGLNTLLKKFSPDSICNTRLSEFKNMSIAIDVSIYAYKYLYNNGNIYYRFLQQIITLFDSNIKPIYIFDGKPPMQKKETLEMRKEIKRKKIDSKNKKLEELKKKDISDIEFFKLQDEIDKIDKSLISITPEIINNLKQMFDLLGINYIQAKEEADTVCCQLYKDGIVSASLSEDFDLLLRGSGVLIREFDYYKKTIVTYNLESILKNLKLEYDEFIDLAILCGCDYTTKISGIGPLTALKLIKKYNNIENIIRLHCIGKKNIIIPDDFNYILARMMMKVPLNEYKEYKATRKFTNNSDQYIKEWLHNKMMIKNNDLSKMLKTIIPKSKNVSDKKSNKSIEHYFTVNK